MRVPETFSHTPEQAPTEPVADAAQLFAEHVETVRNQGDALDEQRYLRKAPAAIAGSTIGLVAGVMTEQTVEWTQDLNPTVNSGLVIAGAFAAVKYMQSRRGHNKGLERYAEPTQQAVGQQYELYRSRQRRRGRRIGPREVSMRWYGPIEGHEKSTSGDTIDNLVYVANLAKTNGVKRIAIGNDLIKDMAPSAAHARSDMTRFLAMKPIRAGGRAKTDAVDIKTPEKWLEFANQERMKHGFSLEAMLARIEQHSFNHPLARIRRAFGAASAVRNTELLRAARVGVERQLDDTQRGWTAGGAPARIHVRGVIVGNGQHVYQYGNGNFRETTSLRSALGMTDKQLMALAQNGEADPQGAIRALEVLAFKKLKKLEQEKEPEEDGNRTPVNPVPSYQQELISPKTRKRDMPDGEKTRLRRHRLNRAGIFAATIALSSIASIFGSDKVSSEYTERYLGVHDAITKERNINYGDLDWDDPELEHRLGPWIAAKKTYDTVGEAADLLDFGPFHLPGFRSYTPDKNPLNPNRASSAQPESRMGNIERSPNAVDWAVSATGDANPLGYWPYMVANRLATSEANGGGVFANWDYEPTDTQQDTRLGLPAAMPTGITSYLTVNRNLALGDRKMLQNGYDNIVSIPVREGTRPVAATMNGQPVDMRQRDDGTYYLHFTRETEPDHDKGGKLTYWLVEDPHAPKVQPTGELKVDTYGDDVIDPAAIDAAWDKILPDLPRANGDPKIDELRSKRIATYISSAWDYQLAPWKGNTLSGVSTWAQQIAVANKIAGANCNIANTLLSIENPSQRPIIGYMNSSRGERGEQIITTHEAHLWTVGKNGFIDATPTGGMSAEDAKHFSEDFNKVPDPGANYWVYGQLAMLAVGLGVWRRRDISRAAQAVESQAVAAAEKRLAASDLEKLRLATSLLEQAGYAPTINVESARQRAARNNASAEQLAARLVRSNAGLHAKHTERTLAATAKQTSGADKRALQHSAHIARKARRIASHKG